MAETELDREGNEIISEGLDGTELSLEHESDTKADGSDKHSPLAADTEKRKLVPNDEDEGGGLDGAEMPDPGVKKQKITMGFSKTFGAVRSVPEKKSPAPITIKLGAQKIKDTRTALQRTSASVASAFNQDSDEEEEMPPEAKMRMRNIGRDTPTSAGPNSFGKTRQGFCDSKKVFERQLKKKMDEVSDK